MKRFTFLFSSRTKEKVSGVVVSENKVVLEFCHTDKGYHPYYNEIKRKNPLSKIEFDKLTEKVSSIFYALQDDVIVDM